MGGCRGGAVGAERSGRGNEADGGSRQTHGKDTARFIETRERHSILLMAMGIDRGPVPGRERALSVGASKRQPAATSRPRQAVTLTADSLVTTVPAAATVELAIGFAAS